MATPTEPDTDQLLRAADRGDAQARGRLLERHRGRLRRMVAVRADPRLAARVDPSDVVQDALAEAAARLDAYLRERPLPFYPWLRQLAWERLTALYRRHVRAQRRSVTREEAEPLGLPDGSVLALADRLLARAASPSEALGREELKQRVRAALDRLSGRDREVLVLRHLEELSAAEVGAVLGLSEAAVKMRALRALKRLRALMGVEGSGDGR